MLIQSWHARGDAEKTCNRCDDGHDCVEDFLSCGLSFKKFHFFKLKNSKKKFEKCRFLKGNLQLKKSSTPWWPSSQRLQVFSASPLAWQDSINILHVNTSRHQDSINILILIFYDPRNIPSFHRWRPGRHRGHNEMPGATVKECPSFRPSTEFAYLMKWQYIAQPCKGDITQDRAWALSFLCP